MVHARVSWRLSFMHEVASALILALASAGRSIAAKMAMIAMTTSNSINVNPSRWRFINFSRSTLNMEQSHRPPAAKPPAGRFNSLRFYDAEHGVAADRIVGLAH